MVIKRPLVMFGDTRSTANIQLLQQRNWGRIFATTKRPTPFAYERWGFDNGAFKAWKDAGFPLNINVEFWNMVWSPEEFYRRLVEAMDADCDPYLAVCPDIPASKESLQYSLNWMRHLPSEWPWYLAVQDGMDRNEVEDVLHLFSGVFLGGSDKFKLGAYNWVRLAHKHQKKFHYARAGTEAKLKHAFAIGADSLDSNFVCWTKERTRELCNLWDGLGTQQELSYG
jgi:hypothetical protein